MAYTMSKYEKETVILYSQSNDPILIDTYDPPLCRRLAEYAEKYPDQCRRTDKQKYPDYAEYEISKDRVSIRLLPPMTDGCGTDIKVRQWLRVLSKGYGSHGIATV